MVLGDTADAESLVSAIARGDSHKVVAAGALDHEIAVRLTDYFTRTRVDAVIDATHPFEASISHQAAKACKTLGLKHLLVAHPPWQAVAGDIWSEVGSFGAAADALTHSDHRAYLCVDARYLAAFSEIPPRIWFLVRRDEGTVPQLPMRNCGIVVDGREPTLESERELIETYRITRLICENDGGERGKPALVAARELQVPVIMVRQPALPDGDRADDVDGAMSWLGEAGVSSSEPSA